MNHHQLYFTIRSGCTANLRGNPEETTYQSCAESEYLSGFSFAPAKFSESEPNLFAPVSSVVQMSTPTFQNGTGAPADRSLGFASCLKIQQIPSPMVPSSRHHLSPWLSCLWTLCEQSRHISFKQDLWCFR